MTLCVTSWVKCGSETKIPICKANIIYFEPNEKEKHFDFPKKNEADVKLCWSCFSSDCQCYSLQQKHVESIEDYFHNLWCFQFSFKELDNVRPKWQKKQCLLPMFLVNIVSHNVGC